MRIPGSASALGLALGLSLSCSSSDGPTAIEIPIATIRIASGGCFVPEGESCSVVAEAERGTVISAPTSSFSRMISQPAIPGMVSH